MTITTSRVLGVAALLGALWLASTHSGSPPSAPVHAVVQAGETREPRTSPRVGESGVFVMDAANVRPAATMRPAAAHPPPLPFSYLGKLTENGETVIVLYAGGRTFKVRGVGPLTDDYQVDAILERDLLIRYVPLGAEQILELAARQPPSTPFSSPDDSPQD